MKKNSLLKILPWMLFLILSLILVYFAGGRDLLENKSISGSNLAVVGVGGIIALVSLLRILGSLIPKSAEVEEQAVEPEITDVADDFILCVHCGKAEPIGTEYCSSCGRRFS